MSIPSRERLNQIVKQEPPELVAALLASMAEHIEEQKQLIEKLQAEQAARLQQKFAIDEKMMLLRPQMFGRKKEDRIEATDRPRDTSQEEALLFSQAELPAPKTREEAGKAKGQNLDAVIVDHGMSDDDLVAEAISRGVEHASADQWRDTGLFDESVKVQIIERKYVREIHRRRKYKLDPKALPNQEKEVIVTAPGPAELLPGMNYTTEFVTSVVADKYISHMPLERQTREMESLGLYGMRNSTLSRLSLLAAVSLEKMQEKIKVELLQTTLALHLDETPWKIQDKDQADGYMWVISNRCGSYYFYRPTRSGQVLKDVLGLQRCSDYGWVLGLWCSRRT
jgi:transposase